MKRFALNKIKIAKLIDSQRIKGKGLDATQTDNLETCYETCDQPITRLDCTSATGVMPCTHDTIDTEQGTNPSITEP